MAEALYEFEWDPVKASANLAKHGVDFERAAEVFLDPLALTISDDEHGATEPRWITIGKDVANRYVLVVHTFRRLTDDRALVRIISARKPTTTEIRSYEG